MIPSTDAETLPRVGDAQRVLFVDASAGVSGDMFLGALVDLGVPVRFLREQLGKLGPLEFRIARSRVLRGGIRGTRCAGPNDAVRVEHVG